MEKFSNNLKVDTGLFARGMQKDTDPRFLEQGMYISAINAALNSRSGDLYKIGNEPSTLECAQIPYTLVGAIMVDQTHVAIFSTDDTDSEVGLLDTASCEYTKIINDRCLNFKTTNLIIGAAKENFDCTVSVYWNDGLNPARTMNLSRPPFIKKFTPDPTGGCDIVTDTNKVDCEALRLTPLLTIPNITLSSSDGGNLSNGAYRVAVAYSSKEIRLSDYLAIGGPQFIYHVTGAGGGLQVSLEGLDKDFDEYQLVLIATVDQQTTARIVGYYSTQQSKVFIDDVTQDQAAIDLSVLPLQSVYYEGGEAMYEVNEFLIQTAIRTRKEFNYQPQASRIRARWVAYAVPENYYRQGGSKIGYPKGETIALFIRFVYNTGHRSSAFSLVGREAVNDEKQQILNDDSRAYGGGERVEKWEIYDTTIPTKTYPSRSDVVEYPIMEGEFGYYESEEEFPDNGEVWGSLACKKRRLFRMPDNCVVPNYDPVKKKLQILGIKLENVTYPLDENGDPVAGIVGYEIFRADREGHRDVMAKGMIYNTGEYESPTAFNEKHKTLYPNYPMNDLRIDPFLSKRQVKGGCSGARYQEMGSFNRQFFTFHSPETHFASPALGSIMKVEAEYFGPVQGSFAPVYQHPKNKLIRDFAFLISALVGVGEGLLAVTGKKTYTVDPTIEELAASPAGVGTNVYKPLPLVSTIIPIGPLADIFGLKGKGATSKTSEETGFDKIPLPLRIANSVILFSYYFGAGASAALEIIKQLVPYQQYAYQYNCEGRYDKQACPKQGNRIRSIENYTYLYPNYQEFEGFRVNNNLRESSVLVKLNAPLTDPTNPDTTRQTIGDRKSWADPTKPFISNTSAYYVSIRRKLKSQYGQIESARLVPTSAEIFPITADTASTSEIVFGGDTIIEEFTLKRKMHYWSQSAVSPTNPNGFEFDYRLYPNIQYPRYWMDSHEYDLSEFFNITDIKLPDDKHYLDRTDCSTKVSFVIKNAYFYLYNSGIVRFFVESTYNLPFRQNSTTDNERKYYDKEFNTDLGTLLRSDVISADNYYRIDKSLSPIKQLPLVYASVQPRDFSVANAKCFAFEPNRIAYSLPSNLESKRDGWRNFLVNNVLIFPQSDGKVTCIKEVNRTGAMYFFENAAAKLHPGVDELQTTGGLKVTVGDGGLFARVPQSISNSDYEFSECQSGKSVVSTHYGVYFISQRQGKILHYTGQIEDISFGIKWWLSEYLPSRLLKQFPTFELRDNPVTGVGCQSIFDNTDEVLYFSKKDYELKPEFLPVVTYLSGTTFVLEGRKKFLLGDPRYFNDASWTISYDPKTKTWISFHDWHPDFLIQTQNHFLSFKDTKVWRHNEAFTFCNYYGVDYPWEVEVSLGNPGEVKTVESIEYGLECYKYFDRDRFHILEESFDRAILYNSEQCSGLLKLHMREPNRPFMILDYPRITPSGIEIEVVKVEQKYRFNQFCDLTKNRGQFTLNWKTIFKTEPNGYKKSLNPSNIDYNKSASERKKFRHNLNSIILRKNISHNVKMLLILSHLKEINSFR